MHPRRQLYSDRQLIIANPFPLHLDHAQWRRHAPPGEVELARVRSDSHFFPSDFDGHHAKDLLSEVIERRGGPGVTAAVISWLPDFPEGRRALLDHPAPFLTDDADHIIAKIRLGERLEHIGIKKRGRS